jgi:threonine/homoserine/homoserine lactone efflux protein
MFEPQVLITYLAASIAIILSPGPAQALVLARTISDGKKNGIVTALGLNVGTIFHAVAAALGLSAIVATSAVAFGVVKYSGAAYLMYLGVKAFRLKKYRTSLTNTSIMSTREAFSKAVWTGILNPKVALFFLAFLPQFVDAHRGSVFFQFLILGLILGAFDALYESALALLAGTVSEWVTGNSRFALWREKITGTVLIALGIRLALTERN